MLRRSLNKTGSVPINHASKTKAPSSGGRAECVIAAEGTARR